MPGPGFEYIDQEEAKLVLKVLNSRQLNRYHFEKENKDQHSMVAQFELEFSSYIGSKYSIAMNSCTSSLMAALQAISISPTDEIVVPCYTFIATAAAVVHVGATPVFCNIDESLTLSANDLDNVCGEKTRGIICAHMLGRPCNMEALLKYAKKNGIFLIEDVAQACGGSYKGTKLGDFGNAACFSFNIFKMITGGDGGALTTSNKNIFERAYAFHDHGFAPGRKGLIDNDKIVGMNLRMNELTGAVLVAQLRKLDKILVDVRQRKNMLINRLILPSFVKELKSNDPQGETATSLVLSFESKRLADKFCEVLNTTPLLKTGRHFYKNMKSIYQGKIEQSPSLKTSLRQSESILERAVVIGIGVLDNYLGSGLGVRAKSREEEIDKLAKRINLILKTL